MTSPQLQRLCVLGATGSVGKSTLDVAARHPDRFEIFALTAHRQTDELFKLCQQYRPRFAALGDALQARLLRDRLGA
ncbi:MAG: 1-deoxy-D-xylulose-5-phosphate reductoisomerase, partial [Burkholderiaceae bacterium]